MKKETIRNVFITSLVMIGMTALWVGGCHYILKSNEETPAKTEPAVKVEKETEMRITERFDDLNVIITIHAWKNNDIVASYWYCEGQRDLTYENTQGRRARIYIEEVDVVYQVTVSGEDYMCADVENANLCKKAAEKVKYWKSIMNWDERVKRILEELKNRKPEDELD